jgi:hypothetical protein
VLQNAVYSLSTLGDIYLVKGDKKKALELELQAYEIIKKKNKWNSYIVVKRIYPFIARAYAANGNQRLPTHSLTLHRLPKIAWPRSAAFFLWQALSTKHKCRTHGRILEKESALQRQTVIRNSFIGGFAIVALFSVVVVRQKKRILSRKKDKRGAAP